MKVCVVGMGYLGATHALAMAKLGHEVVGIDTDSNKIESLNDGRLWFYEPGLEEALVEALSKGSVKFQTSFHMTEPAEVIFMCVGTPQTAFGGSTNTSYVFSAGETLAKVMEPATVFVGKSTVPVGTAAALRELMSGVAGFPVHLAWNPEFLREGTALEDSLKPDRIVISSWDNYSSQKLKEVYKLILDQGTPLVEVDVPTAELVKVAANAFLATKVSFINAMAEIAEVSGADAVELAKAIGYDERIGNKFLRNGIGFGGGCLPKDIRGFVARAEELGAGEAVSFLKDVDAINQRRRARVVTLAEQELGELKDKKILMLGLSFKPDSDDMRDSPALDIALRLAQAGARVTVHDPVSLAALGDKHPELISEQDLSAAAKDQGLVILGTEWSDYKAIDPTAFGDLVANKLIIDGRNVLDVAAWQAAGWRLIALGRNVHN
ncbi:UDP-glucose/GDP-mannose dehydrogenase family protein [Aquiluna sp.]|nr:UDP-glucose/GDP-mannose dehydrogenase family protein [Aquiluna sp.]